MLSGRKSGLGLGFPIAHFAQTAFDLEELLV
jgi:hypothetical protein